MHTFCRSDADFVGRMHNFSRSDETFVGRMHKFSRSDAQLLYVGCTDFVGRMTNSSRIAAEKTSAGRSELS